MSRTAPLAMMLPVVVLLTGCGLLGEDPPDPAQEAGAASDPEAFVQEGHVGRLGNHFEARVEAAGVERLADRTRTTVRITSLEDEPVTMPQDVFAAGGLADRDITGFRLVDTVNQRRYGIHTDIGTQLPPTMEWLPGVAYELMVYSPPLDERVERVTLHTPGSIGEFAGIPVTEGEPRDHPSEPPDTDPEEGDTVVLPAEDGTPAPLDADHADLYGVVENVVQAQDSRDGAETVALHADVLFDFDEAELTEHAEGILGDVIEQTRERADPDEPPILIMGHTDGIGDDAYNQRLSEERAEAVRDMLEEALGPDYEYETRGLGAEHPVEQEGGDDDAWARSQNRRVEIAYAVREEDAPRSSEDTGLSEEILPPDPEAAGEPGRFRSHRDEDPVAEGEYLHQARFTEVERPWTIRVYPFYRDGAYLVARFDVTHDGDDPGDGFFKPFSDTFGGFDFRVLDPVNGTIHREVRRGSPDEAIYKLGAMHWPTARAAGETSYGYFYVPAPPEDVTSVVFHADGFGTFRDIPIEE